MANEIHIELVQGGHLQALVVPTGSTIYDVVKDTIHNARDNAFGIFGKLRSLDHVLQTGDRVEIYQPLLIDPKEARRIRAKKKRKN